MVHIDNTLCRIYNVYIRTWVCHKLYMHIYIYVSYTHTCVIRTYYEHLYMYYIYLHLNPPLKDELTSSSVPDCLLHGP